MSGDNNFLITLNAYVVDFHEIFFITKGKGQFKIDNEIIAVEPGSILLLPPNKWRQWIKIEKPIDGYFLIFEEDFISSFFNDQLFLYHFHFFQKHGCVLLIYINV